MAADQQRLIALAFGQPKVTAMTLQCPSGELLAPDTVSEAPGVVVITPGNPAGTGRQARAETLPGYRPPSRCLADKPRGQLGEYCLVITEHQQAGLITVLEVVAQAFFFRQALDEMQIRFVVLGTVVAFGIGRAEMETVGIALDIVFFQDLGNDLRHGHLLEDALVDPMSLVGQLRTLGDVLERQPTPGFALANAVHLAVNLALVTGAEGQQCQFVQQLFESKARIGADQFKIKTERLVQGFAACEAEYLKISGGAFDRQRNVRSICIQHAGESIHCYWSVNDDR